MQNATEPKPGEAEMPPAFIMGCNRLIMAVLTVTSVVAFFVCYFAINLMLLGGFHPVLLVGLYIFPASLVLRWGHKRISRELACSNFSRVFWPVAAVHYFALITAFLMYGIVAEPARVAPIPKESHGLGYFILAVVICCLPAILSLPPLVFTLQRSLKGRR